LLYPALPLHRQRREYIVAVFKVSGLSCRYRPPRRANLSQKGPYQGFLLRTLIRTSTFSSSVPLGRVGRLMMFSWSAGISLSSPVST